MAPAVGPEWMDASFFKTALGKEIKDARVRPAVAAGENYASLVFRAEVEAADGSHFQLIVKCLPTSEYRVQIVKECEITLREFRMYKETLALLGNPVDCPKCLYATIGENVRDTMVLEDLQPKGFRTRDRRLGLDLAHTLLVMEQIGRLHGAGIALRMSDAEKFEKEIVHKYPEIIYGPENRDKMIPFAKSTMTALADAAVRHLPKRFHEIAEYLREMGDPAVDMMYRDLSLPADRTQRDGLVFTLNHGDTWSSNFLFKYQDEKPIECVLIDFQISRVAYPAVDLLYFFYSSTNQDLRRAHMHEVLGAYFEAARGTLRQHGISDPGRFFYSSVKDVEADMRRLGLLGLLMGCLMMPIVIAASGDMPDVNEMTEDSFQTEIGDDAPFSKIYRGPLFCRRFREMLEDADDAGVFDDPNVWRSFSRDPTPT